MPLYLPITVLVTAAVRVLSRLSCRSNLRGLVDFISPLRKLLEIGLTAAARCQPLAALRRVYFILRSGTVGYSRYAFPYPLEKLL